MTKKSKEKALYIELKRDIRKVIHDYCKETKIKNEDIGFAMGWITGKLNQDPQGLEQLMFLLQIYFFSGVYYAKTTKKFMYKYLDKEERKKFLGKLDDKLSSLLKKDERPPSYMG